MPGEQNNGILVQFKMRLGEITQDSWEALKNLAQNIEKFIGEAATKALEKAFGEERDLKLGAERGLVQDKDPTEAETGAGTKTNESVVPADTKQPSTDQTKGVGGGTGPGKEADPKASSTGEGEEGPSSNKEKADGKRKGFLENVKESAKDPEVLLRVTQKGIHASANMLNTGIKKGFGIVEDIYSRLKSASPLLQAIESMFNLAMQLFFMPLGNKLAEVLIPAVLELVDDVVAIWDSFEGKSLGEMFTFAIDKGTTLIGGFFNDIGDKLIEQGGMVGNIGRLLESVGNFIENNGAQVLNSILGIVTTLLGNIKHFISLWLALKATEIAMDATGPLGSLVGAKALIGAGALLTVFGTTFAASEAGLSAMGLAEGGYVPAKPGGQLAVIAEGGEGEYVVPESKKEAFIKYHGAQITDTAYRESNEGTRSVESSPSQMQYESIFRDDDPTRAYTEDIRGLTQAQPYNMFSHRSPPNTAPVNVNVRMRDSSVYGEMYSPELVDDTPQTAQESRIQNVNITYHINGYTDSELRTIIRETVDEQVAKAVYRS